MMIATLWTRILTIAIVTSSAGLVVTAIVTWRAGSAMIVSRLAGTWTIVAVALAGIALGVACPARPR